jgi:7-cyano-7-deazaguanine synthase
VTASVGSRGLAVVVVSGGLDSVTLSHLLASENWRLHLLAFDYGQRHVTELGSAHRTARRLNARFDLIDLRSLGSLLKGSALTDDIAVPDGHYEAETMKVTIVPNRNAVFLAAATAVAAAEGAQLVAIGIHAGDHAIYPDCRPAFAARFHEAMKLGNEGSLHPGWRVYTPFAHLHKADIVRLGAGLGVPFAETWSCYKGGVRHCGTCGTCVERQEAFDLAGIADPTEYEEVESVA